MTRNFGSTLHTVTLVLFEVSCQKTTAVGRGTVVRKSQITQCYDMRMRP